MAEKQQLSDADLQQLLKALQKHGPQSEAARLVFQGLTLGFSDEIEALVRAPFDSREYSEIRDDIRGKISAHRERVSQSHLHLIANYRHQYLILRILHC